MTHPVKETYTRRALRTLRMLHELHVQGFQRLRFAAGPVPAGGHWRISIAPAEMLQYIGGEIARPEEDIWNAEHRGNWGDGNHFFGWKDATTANAWELAKLFQDRFPRICERGKGRDWAYAGWFQELLGVAEQGFLPMTNRSDQYLPEFLCGEVHWGTEKSIDPIPPFPRPPGTPWEDIAPGDSQSTFKHWTEDRYWTDALDRWVEYRDSGRTSLTMNVQAIDHVAFLGDGPAYKLMNAVASLSQGDDDCGKGAPRIMLALLMRLHELR